MKKYESTVKGMKDPIIDYKQMAEDLQSEVDRLKYLIVKIGNSRVNEKDIKLIESILNTKK